MAVKSRVLVIVPSYVANNEFTRCALVSSRNVTTYSSSFVIHRKPHDFHSELFPGTLGEVRVNGHHQYHRPETSQAFEAPSNGRRLFGRLETD